VTLLTIINGSILAYAGFRYVVRPVWAWALRPTALEDTQAPWMLPPVRMTPAQLRAAQRRREAARRYVAMVSAGLTSPID
jgi:hypothetical protein